MRFSGPQHAIDFEHEVESKPHHSTFSPSQQTSYLPPALLAGFLKSQLFGTHFMSVIVDNQTHNINFQSSVWKVTLAVAAVRTRSPGSLTGHQQRLAAEVECE